MDMSTEYEVILLTSKASRSGIGQDRSSHAGSKAPKFVGESVPPDFKVRGWHSLEKERVSGELRLRLTRRCFYRFGESR